MDQPRYRLAGPSCVSLPTRPLKHGPGESEEAGGEAKAPSCGPTSQGCSPGDDMVPCTDRPPAPGG